jgi:PAS domain S-box-containing protein
VVGTSGTLADVTERHRAEAALRASERQYRALVDNSQGLICTHDLNGTLRAVNPAAATHLGYRPEALIGSSLADLLVPGARTLFPTYLHQLHQSGSASGTMHLRTSSGEEWYWLYHNTLHYSPDEAPYVQGYAQDITTLKRAEAALRQSEERFRTLATLEPALVRELVDLFLNHAPQQIAALEHCLRDGAFSDVQGHAHTLKGACGNLDLRALGRHCAEVERYAASHDSVDLKNTYEALTAAFYDVITPLEQLRHRLLTRARTT